jgi:hypothetical protein
VRRDTLLRTCVFASGEFTGQLVHSCSFGLRNINALFFLLGWDQCGFHKKRTGTHYAELLFFHPVGSACHVVNSVRPEPETSMHYFYARVGSVWIQQKARQDTLRGTCVLATGVICGSHSVFWCVRVAKVDVLFSMKNSASMFHAPDALECTT